VDPAFSLRGLSKTYGEGAAAVRALAGVDLEIDEGELIVLLGPSGSGKSTLLNILGGLDRATSGEVAFRGASLTEMNDHALTHFRRTHVGFIFQFYNLIPSLTARENVELVREIAENPLSTDEVLALVGLSERAEHFPAQLSGGEQQRVALARAAAPRPAILLADEPTGNLDSTTEGEIMQLLGQLNEEGRTIIMVTHETSVARRAKRQIIMKDGLIASEGLFGVETGVK